jgi:hypothetical protein
MNTKTTAIGAGTGVVLTGIVVAAGYWAKGNKVPMRAIIGMGIVAISLAGISEVNATFAGQLGMLIAVAAVFYWGGEIAKGINGGLKKA